MPAETPHFIRLTATPTTYLRQPRHPTSYDSRLHLLPTYASRDTALHMTHGYTYYLPMPGDTSLHMTHGYTYYLPTPAETPHFIRLTATPTTYLRQVTPHFIRLTATPTTYLRQPRHLTSYDSRLHLLPTYASGDTSLHTTHGYTYYLPTPAETPHFIRLTATPTTYLRQRRHLTSYDSRLHLLPTYASRDTSLHTTHGYTHYLPTPAETPHFI